MKIGIDIDNTVLSYDDAFRKAADSFLQLKILPGMGKEETKSFVVAKEGEASWTRLQGIVYSSVPKDVSVSEGFEAFLAQARVEKVAITYVSHKTKFPISGSKKDMRAPITSLMKAQGHINPETPGAEIYFCSSLEAKIEKINSLGFDYFIDDLATVLEGIVPGTKAVHLGCRCLNVGRELHTGMANWTLTREFFFG